jgi:glycosyltransferase involved in cell wall biosynthesis
MRASVVVLCRDNPYQLEETLSSLVRATQGLEPPFALELLVLDGSTTEACRKVFDAAALQPWNQRLIHRPPQGIYDAMNAALWEVNGSWVAFMNAGDLYTDGGLTLLLLHAEAIASTPGLQPPAAVFGQAWVEPPGWSLRWLTPDSAMNHLDRWLDHMVPCHQSMLFSVNFARLHPYALNSGTKADRIVMRAALASGTKRVYLPIPVCRYRLDGQSSRMVDWTSLTAEGLRPGERLGEYMKVTLSQFRVIYPLMMWLRSRWFGWIC